MVAILTGYSLRADELIIFIVAPASPEKTVITGVACE
jgi:hypothetical protein